jgi:hypothetical protein
VIESPEKMEPGQHAGHGDHHHLQLPLGEAQCEPKHTYQVGPLGSQPMGRDVQHGLKAGPIDISGSEPLPVDRLKIAYEPSALDIVDCNEYRILVKFPPQLLAHGGKNHTTSAKIAFSRALANTPSGANDPECQSSSCTLPEGVFLIIEGLQ